ncbi:GAF domain-containing protein [Methylorubrum extorquens]|uniref:GAF domain-containing protein n=1 Tax=Methylorubrum extorquens TaxID=408 RepID=UPI001EE53743|nr:GAF domain-containing protein [Methylorubrum extorquens]MCG5249634.1 GAF domain-containing protein [Methylorubrum extorquens]
MLVGRAVISPSGSWLVWHGAKCSPRDDDGDLRYGFWSEALVLRAVDPPNFDARGAWMLDATAVSEKSARVRALRQSGLLYRTAQEQFGHLTNHVRDVLDVPVAIVTLVDEDRQVFAGHSGLPAPWGERGETPMTHSFCQYVVDRNAPLQVTDARVDPLLKDNHAIGDIGVVAYLGIPLALPDGEIVGALAAIDTNARAWSEADMRRLRSIARTVEKEMDVRISESRWRTLFENMQEGFILGRVVRDPAGRITDWRYEEVNAAWHELVGVPQGSAIGQTVREVFPGIEDAWVDEFAKVVETGETERFTRQVGVLDRWYDGVVQPIGSDRFTVIFLEVTNRVAHERRQAALLHLGDTLRDARSVPDITLAAAKCVAAGLVVERIGFGPVDEALEAIDVPVDWCAPDVVSVAGKHDFRAFGSYIDNLKRGETVEIEDVFADPRTVDSPTAFEAIQTRALLNLPIMENGRLVLIVFAHSREPRSWTTDELQFVRQVGDRTQAAIARIRAEETQAVLNGELSHRLKNSFAMVQAIVGQTLKTVSERGAVEALNQRLYALASAHDVLMQQSWSSAPLQDVAKAVLHVFEVSDRFMLRGQNIQIGSRATLSLSLLLHELATNALKYGSLSVPEGRVEIEWGVRPVNGEDTVHLIWRERGGLPPSQPSGRGFGSRIIRMGLIGAGGVDLTYEPEGFQAAMSASLSQMQQV